MLAARKTESTDQITARRQLNELFLQFDNVATAYQFYNAIHDSINCLNDALSPEAPI